MSNRVKERNSFPTTFENYADVSINKIQNSVTLVGKVVTSSDVSENNLY